MVHAVWPKPVGLQHHVPLPPGVEGTEDTHVEAQHVPVHRLVAEEDGNLVVARIHAALRLRLVGRSPLGPSSPDLRIGAKLDHKLTPLVEDLSDPQRHTILLPPSWTPRQRSPALLPEWAALGAWPGRTRQTHPCRAPGGGR
eukprot:3767133-Pyramimonas_sp.AAC.1